MQDARAGLRRGVGGRLHEQPPPKALHVAEVLHRTKWTAEALCRMRCNAGSVTATAVIPDNASAFDRKRKFLGRLESDRAYVSSRGVPTTHMRDMS